MDFALTERQKKIQNSVREFIRSEFDKDKIRDWDQTHTFPREIWKKAAHSGFIGIHFPGVRWQGNGHHGEHPGR